MSFLWFGILIFVFKILKVALGEVSVSVWSLNRYTLLELNVNHWRYTLYTNP